jgi:purine nucleoside permease
MRFLKTRATFLTLLAAGAAAVGLAQETPVKVKVVVLTMFEVGADKGDGPGEFQLWGEREKLEKVYPLPAAHHDVLATADGAVIATVTGMGTARAAASVMALGLDPRFDLSKAYWVVAGIAGVDPADASIGSAVWAEWVVDGDLAHEIDPREMPKGWTTGYLPLHRKKPYEPPVDRSGGEAYRLNAGLVDWAYRITQDTPLMDTEGMAKRRALYVGFPNAQKPPFVLKGDNLAAMTYWHGKILNAWANDWVKYYTDGKGEYVTTAMEDTGTLQSLTWLAKAGKVDVNRVLVLRTASNFDMQWPGGDAAESLSGEKLEKRYSAYIPALEAAHKVGSKVVHELVRGWEKYEAEIPGK